MPLPGHWHQGHGSLIPPMSQPACWGSHSANTQYRYIHTCIQASIRAFIQTYMHTYTYTAYKCIFTFQRISCNIGIDAHAHTRCTTASPQPHQQRHTNTATVSPTHQPLHNYTTTQAANQYNTRQQPRSSIRLRPTLRLITHLPHRNGPSKCVEGHDIVPDRPAPTSLHEHRHLLVSIRHEPRRHNCLVPQIQCLTSININIQSNSRITTVAATITTQPNYNDSNNNHTTNNPKH